MSSRQLKKLRAQEEKQALATQVDEGDETSSSEEEVQPRVKNAFAAFAALGIDNDEEDEEDKENVEEIRPAAPAAQPAAKASKKKKKAKKKKTKVHEAAEPIGKKLGSKAGKHEKSREDDGDEIDRVIRELEAKKRQQQLDTIATPPSGSTGSEQLLTVNLHDLKVLHELRDMFGSETIRAARADEAHNNGGAQQGERVDGNPGMVMVDLETFLRGTPPAMTGMGRRAGAMVASAVAVAGKRAMSDAVARRNPFIEFKDTWPRAPSGGLGMRQITEAATAGGVVEYTYTHSPAYVQLDNTFFMLVMMHNHHPLIQFLKQNPYHIASLIQVSRIAKQDQNAALATDLCERALFSFGRSTLSSFRQKLGEGRARLSFRRPENRQFLLAGYYYIKSLISRGTHRTALAWVRLFLSLMPGDEYALLLWGQALAVRAGEEKWLLAVMGVDGGPGIPALQRNPMRAYLRQSVVVARLQLGDEAGARAALQTGLAELPWLYVALFQALNLDVPRSIWGQRPRDGVEGLFTMLYIKLSSDLWEPANVTALLRDVAGSAAKSSELVSPPPAAPPNLSIARFIYLDGTPALMELVPGDMLHVSPNYDFDPLPPMREENVFSHVGQERPWIVAANEEEEGGRGHGAGWDVDMWLPGGMVEQAQFADPGFDEDELGTSDEEEEEEENTREEETSEEQYARQRTSGMPGAWIEDVEDEEFQR